MGTKLSLLLATSIILPSLSFAAGEQVNQVAKAIVLAGSVGYKTDDKAPLQKLAKDDWLPEGAIILTGDKSFVKLLFVDKSQMNLGPNGKLAIAEFTKDKPGIISLLKGQIRSTITKDYMKMDEKDQSKLFVKTQTAAMGVRGTDFQVGYNPENQNTALITFSGSVAFAKIEDHLPDHQVDQRALEQIVSSDQAVMVTKGQFSGVNPKAETALPPVKLSPVQLEQLQTNDVEKQVSAAEAPVAEQKQFRNPIPPGVDNKAFANTGNEIEKQLSTTVGSAVVEKATQEIATEQAAATKAPAAGTAAGAPAGVAVGITGNMPPGTAVGLTGNQPPEQSKSGAPAVGGTGTATPAPTMTAGMGAAIMPAANMPRPGGVLDLNTLTYVEPPKNAAFDANTGTFVLPPEFGKVTAAGGYQPPAGLTISNDGRFVADPNYKAPVIAPPAPGAAAGDPAKTGPAGGTAAPTGANAAKIPGTTNMAGAPGTMAPGMAPGTMAPGMAPGMMTPGMAPGMMTPGMTAATMPGMMGGSMTPGMGMAYMGTVSPYDLINKPASETAAIYSGMPAGSYNTTYYGPAGMPGTTAAPIPGTAVNGWSTTEIATIQQNVYQDVAAAQQTAISSQYSTNTLVRFNIIVQ